MEINEKNNNFFIWVFYDLNLFFFKINSKFFYCLYIFVFFIYKFNL